MKLQVRLMKKGSMGETLTREHPNCYDYKTNDGELDIYDPSGAVVIATYNRDKWESVLRIRDEGEEWPDEIVEVHVDEDEEGDGSFDPSSFTMPTPFPGGISWRGRGG